MPTNTQSAIFLFCSPGAITYTQYSDRHYFMGVFNLSNQFSNFSKNWEIKGCKSEVHEFHGVISPHFCNANPKIATIFTETQEKCLEICQKTMIKLAVKQLIVYLVENWSEICYKLLTQSSKFCQLSDVTVRELET